MDFYKLLRIPPSASVSEVKVAFYGLAKQCHPDMVAGHGTGGGRASTDERFKQIHEAYQTLIHNRALYDEEYQRHYRNIPESLRSLEENDLKDFGVWPYQKKSGMKTERNDQDKTPNEAKSSRRTVHPTPGPWGSSDKPSFLHLKRLSQTLSFLDRSAPLKKSAFYWSEDDDPTEDDANQSDLDYLSMMDLQSCNRRIKRRFRRAGNFQKADSASPSPFCSKTCDSSAVTPGETDSQPTQDAATDKNPGQGWPNGGRFLHKGKKV